MGATPAGACALLVFLVVAHGPLAVSCGAKTLRETARPVNTAARATAAPLAGSLTAVPGPFIGAVGLNTAFGMVKKVLGQSLLDRHMRAVQSFDFCTIKLRRLLCQLDCLRPPYHSWNPRRQSLCDDNRPGPQGGCSSLLPGSNDFFKVYTLQDFFADGSSTARELADDTEGDLEILVDAFMFLLGPFCGPKAPPVGSTCYLGTGFIADSHGDRARRATHTFINLVSAFLEMSAPVDLRVEDRVERGRVGLTGEGWSRQKLVAAGDLLDLAQKIADGDECRDKGGSGACRRYCHLHNGTELCWPRSERTSREFCGVVRELMAVRERLEEKED